MVEEDVEAGGHGGQVLRRVQSAELAQRGVERAHVAARALGDDGVVQRGQVRIGAAAVVHGHGGGGARPHPRAMRVAKGAAERGVDVDVAFRVVGAQRADDARRRVSVAAQ